MRMTLFRTFRYPGLPGPFVGHWVQPESVALVGSSEEELLAAAELQAARGSACSRTNELACRYMYT